MFIKYNFPGIIWALLILLLLGLPSNNFPETSFLNIHHLDKIVHGGLFLVFVFLLTRGFYMQNSFSFVNKNAFILSIIAGILYGGFTEILQGNVFTERTSDIFDFLADVAGCIIGLLIFSALRQKYVFKK
ncbi:MAG: VanZ family protein [Bacteroidetes bacterium]|nr:VanZ family protein [Bacteroidota bacterium]